ncbi:MAG: DASS family sodium-coupled anion symporter [Brachymonas sp.]|nr:DASS family sodium-coupled anion symporter [Brachymonas sp.]
MSSNRPMPPDTPPALEQSSDEMRRPATGSKMAWVIVAAALAVSWGIYAYLPFEGAARKGLALLFFVAVLWLTEAVHVTITALIVPVAAVAIGIPEMNTAKALSTFADPIIFLFFGGFALATALHVQKLDRKIAFWIMSLTGSHLGMASIMLFVVTAALSMWISNTATAAMLLPLAIGIIGHMDGKEERNTMAFVLLGIAYSASIGGLGTLVGSPPNAIAAKALKMDFAAWLKVGLPIMLLLLPLMVLTLWLVFRPQLNRRIELPREDIPWTRDRILTIVVFVITALAWIFGKQVQKALGVSSPDTWVAVSAAITVCMLGLASWRQVANNTDWGVLFLFGGGITLSNVMRNSGASAVLGDTVAGFVAGASPFAVIIGVAAFIVLLTEFTSNTASAALLVPVFAAIAERMGMPSHVLVLIIGIGASCAFMLPVATPPNAIVYGTGKILQRDMLKAGAVLNTISITLLAIWAFVFWR